MKIRAIRRSALLLAALTASAAAAFAATASAATESPFLAVSVGHASVEVYWIPPGPCRMFIVRPGLPVGEIPPGPCRTITPAYDTLRRALPTGPCRSLPGRTVSLPGLGGRTTVSVCSASRRH
jgi:hypothetical protein